MTRAPQFRYRCPRCSGSQLIEVRRYLADPEPLAFIQCGQCNWEAIAQHGIPQAATAGRAIYDREMEANLATHRAEAAAANAAQAARDQQARIERSERIALAWAQGPIQARVVNRGEGYVVALPALEDGTAWEDLSQAVRTACDRASGEAEIEATRLNDLAAAQLAQRPAIQRQLWAEQAARDAEARKQRREERTDVELSRPT